MIVVVSPYHLTTREPAALAAMLLADRVVTMLPAPLAGKEWGDVKGAAERVPRYFEFMQSWQWTVPLWKAGVIVSGLEGQEAVGELRGVCERVDRDGRFAALRSLMRADLFEDHERYLDAFARDLLKAGPDPGITVPVAAGLDLFAMRHGALVARSEPASVVQRAEVEMGEPAFAVSAPVLLQASGERILEARELLEGPLAALREAFDRAAALEGAGGEAKAILSGPARAYAEAFDAERDVLLESDPGDDARVVEGTVMLTGVRLPPDCVLDSSMTAMRTMGVRGGVSGDATPRLTGAVGRAVKVMALYVRVLGRPAASAARR